MSFSCMSFIPYFADLNWIRKSTLKINNIASLQVQYCRAKEDAEYCPRVSTAQSGGVMFTAHLNE